MSNCVQMTTFDTATNDMLRVLGTSGKKINTLLGILKSAYDNDPKYFSSLSNIWGLNGAVKSFDAMLQTMTGGQIKSYEEYRVLKEKGKADGKNYLRTADLMLDFTADKMVEDIGMYGEVASKWFDVTVDAAMKGWTSSVRAASAAERINNTTTTIMNFQNDLSILFKQCPVVDEVRSKYHAMQSIIVGRVNDFNGRYSDYIKFVVDNFGKEGLVVVDKYMHYMDGVNANYNADGTGGDFRELMSALSSDKNVSNPAVAFKTLVAARDKFWSEFNYGSPENPSGNHFSQMASIDNAKGSFALFQKEIGTYLSDIMMMGLKTYGIKVSELSDVHWGILSRFAKEAEIKPFLDEYNKMRSDIKKAPLQLDPYELKRGYIPTKEDNPDFTGMFKDYANIHTLNRGHKAQGGFLTALADQIQKMNYSPIAFAEELNIKMIDNVINFNNNPKHADYLLWREQRPVTAKTLEKHIDKAYSIIAYHKDSVTDKASAKVADYKRLSQELGAGILPFKDHFSSTDADMLEKNWTYALRELSGIKGDAKDAKHIEDTVRKANKYVSILENQVKHIDTMMKTLPEQERFRLKPTFDEMSNKVSTLRSIEKEAADFDYNSINISVNRMQNLVKNFESIEDVDARLDFVSRGRSMVAYLKDVKNRIDSAPSVFERKKIYEDANKSIDSAINNLYYLDSKYGKLKDRAGAELQKYIRRSSFILENMKKVASRTKDSTAYVTESTWLGTKSAAMYTSLVMTNILNNSAMSNLIGATSSAMSLAPGAKQIVLANSYRRTRKSDAVMNQAITRAVDKAAATVSGASKEAELFDTTAALSAEQSKLSVEYIKGVPSMALQRLINNNMQSGPMAGVRTLFNVFGKDPKWMRMEGLAGLFTMAGSENSLMIRGFSKAMVDDSVRSKIALMEEAGIEVKPADVERITEEVIRDQGDSLRKFMDVTRGRFTKDNKSPWGWGAAELARTKPEVFKGLLFSTMLAFKQPMAFAGNAFSKSVFRLMFGVGHSIKSGSLEPLHGAAIAGPVMAAGFMALRYWLDDDGEDDNVFERFFKSPLYSSSFKGLMPTDILESNISLFKTGIGMLTGIPTSRKDYDAAVGMVSRVPGPIWDNLLKGFIDELLADESNDVDGWFVERTPTEYAVFAKNRIGTMQVDPETHNALESILIHTYNLGYQVKKESLELVDFPMLAARSVFGDHDYSSYAERESELKGSVRTMIPFIGPMFGTANDHVSGLVRILNFTDLMLSYPEDKYSQEYWTKRRNKQFSEMLLSPFGFNGYFQKAADYSRSSFQIGVTNKAIRESLELDPLEKNAYSKKFTETVDKLYEYHQEQLSIDRIEDFEDSNP